MANKIKKIEVVGKVGEVSTSPKAMQKTKPDPDLIQATKPKLSPDEQSRLNKALVEAIVEYKKIDSKDKSRIRERVLSLLEAGAEPQVSVKIAKPKLSPDEQSRLNKELCEAYVSALSNHKEVAYVQRIISLLEAGAELEYDPEWHYKQEEILVEMSRMREEMLEIVGTYMRTMQASLGHLILDEELRQEKSLYPDALLAVAKGLAAASSVKFHTWSHTVCHFAESMLALKENRPAAELLINEAVKRAIANKEIGCVDRIVGPLREYNLKNAQNPTSGEFIFKPKSLEDPEFIKLSEPKNQAFCESKTLEELHLKMVEIAKSVSDKKALIGLYVDVDGTLIMANGQLNERVCEEIRKVESAKEEVAIGECAYTIRNAKIFTGGSPKEAEERLRKLGLEEEFLHVYDKSSFSGEKLEIVIDDTPPEYQGFAAKKWISPDKL